MPREEVTRSEFPNHLKEEQFDESETDKPTDGKLGDQSESLDLDENRFSSAKLRRTSKKRSE